MANKRITVHFDGEETVMDSGMELAARHLGWTAQIPENPTMENSPMITNPITAVEALRVAIGKQVHDWAMEQARIDAMNEINGVLSPAFGSIVLTVE